MRSTLSIGACVLCSSLLGMSALAQTPAPMAPMTRVPLPPMTPASAASAASPALPASAPGRVLRPQADPARRLSPAEMSAASRSPEDQGPAKAVVPQIAIPFGRQAPTADAAPAPPGVRPAAQAAPGGVDDRAARCEAREDEVSRAACRRELERSRPRP